MCSGSRDAQVALCLYVHFGSRVLLQLEVFLSLLVARLTDARSSQASELQEAALEVCRASKDVRVHELDQKQTGLLPNPFIRPMPAFNSVYWRSAVGPKRSRSREPGK